MKKLISAIVIGITMLGAKANHMSALNLKMFDNGMFAVVLDEQPSCQQSNFFSVSGIEPGYHKLKVIRYFATPYGFSMMQKVVYKGWINVPAKSVMYARINCHSQFDVIKIEPNFCHPHGGGHGNNDWEEDEYGSSEYGYNNEEHHGNGWAPAPPAPPMPMCMTYESFMQLKNSIASRSFEDSRMEVARQALSGNYFTSTQIATLTHLFTFESNRLEFAKAAYGKTIDRQNYFLVNDAFAFENSISALNEYIAMKR
jgi:hypothetical protein